MVRLGCRLGHVLERWAASFTKMQVHYLLIFQFDNSYSYKWQSGNCYTKLTYPSQYFFYHFHYPLFVNFSLVLLKRCVVFICCLKYFVEGWNLVDSRWWWNAYYLLMFAICQLIHPSLKSYLSDRLNSYLSIMKAMKSSLDKII